MMKYEDTHYLLYIYDLMRIRVLALPAASETSDPPLIEVYKRSYDVCTQLYEKELLTDTSYLYIYGLQDAGLNARQLVVVSGLYEWRGVVARADDEKGAISSELGEPMNNPTKKQKMVKIVDKTPVRATDSCVVLVDGIPEAQWLVHCSPAKYASPSGEPVMKKETSHVVACFLMHDYSVFDINTARSFRQAQQEALVQQSFLLQPSEPPDSRFSTPLQLNFPHLHLEDKVLLIRGRDDTGLQSSPQQDLDVEKPSNVKELNMETPKPIRKISTPAKY